MNNGRFAPLTYPPQDVSPLAWSFHFQDVLPSGRFAL